MGWTTKEGSQLHSQPIKASALLDREAQQESLKKASYMFSSINPCTCLGLLLVDVTVINTTTFCRFGDACSLD